MVRAMDHSRRAFCQCAGLALALGLSASPFAAQSAEPSGNAAHGPVMDGPFYMRPRPIIAPMMADGGIVHIGVMVAIEIPDKAAYEKAREVEPRLMDAMIRELNAIVSGPWVRSNGVDHGVVKRRFLAACVRILGNQIVKDVFVEKSYRRRVS